MGATTFSDWTVAMVVWLQDEAAREENLDGSTFGYSLVYMEASK